MLVQWLAIVVIVSSLKNEFVQCLLTEEEYNDLPPIYHIGDYKKCEKNNNTFCSVTITLKPENENSRVWRNIQKTIKNKNYYNHDEIFHAICLEEECPKYKKEQNDLNNVISSCYTEKFKQLQIKAEIADINCNIHNYNTGFFEISLACTCVLYLVFVFWMTFLDYRQSKRNVKYLTDYKEKVFMKPFSLYTNWKKLNRISQNPEFQKLKSLQGIRFYNMLLIIFCHTFSSYIGGYIQNTIYFEKIQDNLARHLLRNLLVFLVQTFFLFSAWLLSFHFFQILENSNVSIRKYVTLTFLNRYLRIIPPLLVMITFGYSTLIFTLFFDGPIKEQFSHVEYIRCQKNWWSTLLFVNNICTNHDMCYFISWYLSADTQLYLVSLIIFAIIWKMRKKAFQVMSFFVVIALLIPGIVCYIYDLDVIFRITPENSKINSYISFTFNASYTSTYCNAATYMVGLVFGYFYYKYNNTPIFINKFRIFLWWILFLGLPTLVIALACFEYSKITTSVLVCILRPLYATGIGIGIFGMSEKLGGIVRKICEWEPALLLGNITYSTYVVHYAFVFYRTSTATSPLYVSDWILFKSFIKDSLASFLFGFFMHILVEMPALQLQKIFVPQIRASKKQLKKDS